MTPPEIVPAPVLENPTPPPVAPPPLQPALGELQGHLDFLTRRRLNGWAVNTTTPNDPVLVVIRIDGNVVGRMLANRFRQDLHDAGVGNGCHAFQLEFPPLSPFVGHVVHISRESDSAELLSGPRYLPPAESFDRDVEQRIADLLADLESDFAEAHALTFLAQQTDLLLSRHADRQAGRSTRQAQAMLQRRWGALAEPLLPSNSSNSPVIRALIIDNCVPQANRDAGSVAILSHMRSLTVLGYDVSFVAALDMAEQEDSEALGQQANITICRAPFYATVEDVLKRQASCFDLIYLHRAANAEQYLALSRRYQPRARIVYAVADLHHLRLARQAEVQQRPELTIYSRQVAFTEFTAARLADAVITHSPFEATLLGKQVTPAKVHVVPWAVPLRPCMTPFDERCGIACVGHFGHAPNPDAVFWLTREIMPLVWAQDMTIRCIIVGSGWTHDALPFWDDRIDVVGAVADLQEVFLRVRLTVAPLRFGAGIKGKVLESFAAGIPCIMSPMAAEGLALSPSLLDLVGGDAEAIASAIIRFHADGLANHTVALAGLEMIAASHSEQAVITALSGILTSAPLF